jgi:nicotinamidase-related amidase
VETLDKLKEGGGSEVAILVQGDHGDVTFTRRLGQVSAMSSPGLQAFLEEKGTNSLIVTGLSTSGCVLFTALAAIELGYVVTTISDACADPKPGVHDVLVGQVLNNRGWAMTTDEFRKGFESAT